MMVKDWVSYVKEQNTQAWFAFVAGLLICLNIAWGRFASKIGLPETHTWLHNGEGSPLICLWGLTGQLVLHLNMYLSILLYFPTAILLLLTND